MSLSTYTELQAAVIAWSHRDGDSAFAALVPDFVRLAEARFNRVLRTRAMEATLASTALSSGAATLPDGFLAFKELRYDSDSGYTLEPRPLEWVKDRNQSGDASDTPRYFAVSGTEVVCSGQSGSIKGTYYTEIPPLAGNDTNWLLTSHPDLYLFATLVESVLYTQDDSRIPIWAEKTAALLQAVQSSDLANSINGGPLTVRVR